MSNNNNHYFLITRAAPAAALVRPRRFASGQAKAPADIKKYRLLIQGK